MCATEHLAEPMLGPPFSRLTVCGTIRPVRNPSASITAGIESERCDESASDVKVRSDWPVRGYVQGGSYDCNSISSSSFEIVW
jgi:hypothetical protein